jgi:hypothetical protein
VTLISETQDVADRLGITLTRVESPDWDTLMQAGIVVTLHISRWRAARRRSLSDMGVVFSDSDETAAYTDFADDKDLGAEKLLPVEMIKRMNSIENAARSALRSRAIKTRWGYFLPIREFAAWKLDNDRRKYLYLAIRAEIDDQYSEIRNRAERAYRDAAKGAYRRAQGDPSVYVPYSFLDTYAQTRMARFMSQTELNASISWTEEYTFLPIPSLLAQEQAERERILAEAKLTTDQRNMLLTINADTARDAANAKKRMVDDFLKDVQTELRGRILDAATDVLAALKKNPRLPVSSLNQVRDLVVTIDRMNILDDAEVRDQMSTLKALVGSRGTQDINEAMLRERLSEIASTTRTFLSDLDQGLRDPREGLEGGIALAWTEPETREGRLA